MNTLITPFLLIGFASALLSTPQTFAAESALSPEQIAAIMKTPEIQTVLSKSIEDRYKKETKAWFLGLSTLARNEKTMQGFFDKLYGPESTLTSDDRTYLKEIFNDAPAPKIVTTKNGIKVSMQGQSFTFELGNELGTLLMNGKPAQDVDLSNGVRAAVESSKTVGLLHHFRTSPSLALLTHIPQAHAVVPVPLVVVVAGTVLRHAVIGAVGGAVSGAVVGSAAGCAYGVHYKENYKTYLEGCKEGLPSGAAFAGVMGGGAFAAGLGAGGLVSVWQGDSDGMIGKGLREIRPDEIPKIQKFIKIGGTLGAIAAAYHPVKSVAEGYGVKLECRFVDGGWKLSSMHAGKQGITLASHEGAAADETRKQYEKMLIQRAIPENSRPALLTKMMKEHNERTEFCKKNPGKIDSAIFSDIKSAIGVYPKPEAQGVRK
ncbi:MAG: hypothetical protein IPJ84_20780 [Bdellovibrionales bacterium]|nr:hypothetical protein [Bdellovibrionales bacterium]